MKKIKFLRKESCFLRMLKFSYDSNTEDCEEAYADKRGNRYTDSLKMVCSYLFLIGGRRLYNFMVDNLLIPCISTLNTFINDHFYGND